MGGNWFTYHAARRNGLSDAMLAPAENSAPPGWIQCASSLSKLSYFRCDDGVRTFPKPSNNYYNYDYYYYYYNYYYYYYYYYNYYYYYYNYYYYW